MLAWVRRKMDGQRSRRRTQGCGGNRALPRQRGAPVRRSERLRLAGSSYGLRDRLLSLSWVDCVQEGVLVNEYFWCSQRDQMSLLAQHPPRECESSRNFGCIKDPRLDGGSEMTAPAFSSCPPPWPRPKDTRGSTNQPPHEQGTAAPRASAVFYLLKPTVLNGFLFRSRYKGSRPVFQSGGSPESTLP